MKNETEQLFRSLQALFDACSEHDITYDLFMSSADTTAYHAALEEISSCIACIRSSGISRDRLLQLVGGMDPECCPGLSGIIDLADLVPFMGVPFSIGQQELIRKACREWASAVVPSDTGWMADLLRALIEPMTLADLLSTDKTRMQRFLLLLLLQDTAGGHISVTGPGWAEDGRIPVQITDDPAVFCGRLYQAVFLFLVRNGYIPESCFPDLISRTLYDIGVLSTGGRSAIERVYGEGASTAKFSDAGRDLLLKAGSLSDIRALYRSALKTGSAPVSLTGLEEMGGHILAGYVTARAEAAESTGIAVLLDVIRAVASRPTGRAEPGAEQLQELSKTVQEMEQLIRAVTGEYGWRAVPVPPGRELYHPVVDLWHDRHLLLYDREDLAYRSRNAALALSMEALYRYWFTCLPAGDHTPDNPWFNRLAGVVLLPRAVSQGRLLQPGAARWLEELSAEEYDPASMLAERSRIGHMPLPDRYLHAALYEGRTGADDRDIGDASVVHALEATREARRQLADPRLSDEECHNILFEQIWPLFERLCRFPAVSALHGRISQAGSGERSSPQIAPRGEAPRVDRSVPSPHRPVSPTTGRTVAAGESDLLEDDGFSVPGGVPGDSAGQEGNPVASSSGAGSSPSEGVNNATAGSAIMKTADDLMQACNSCRDMLDGRAGNPPESPGEPQGSEDGSPSALGELAEKINTLAEDLENQVRNLLKSAPSGGGGGNPPDGGTEKAPESGEEWEGLLKMSEEIRKAAREYRDSVEKMDLSGPHTGSGTSGARTGMTRETLMDLQKAGIEFQRIAGASFPADADGWRARVSLEELPDDPGTGEPGQSMKKQHLEPALMADAADSAEYWENLAYFDAVYGDETGAAGPSSGQISRDAAERRYRQGERALSLEAEQYLCTLRQRTPDEWESIEEKAERIRRIALLETHSVGEDDYSLYQRFYQPVAGLVGVARKNIQQAIQKNASSREMTELLSGDDIDEENLAAVRTTMRIFKDSAREQDRTRWLISLLIDASSSMHDETVAKKLEATLRTAILFGEAVNRIEGIQFEIAAFADTEYIPLKRYRDDWNIHQACYLIRQVMQASGGTNDVGALGSALDRMNRLRTAPGANRLVFVLSDGQSGVGGREQMKQILSGNRETRIFGWGVGPDMEEIEETYRPYGTWIPDIADLPRSMGEVLRRELGRPAMTGWKDDSAVATDEEIME